MSELQVQFGHSHQRDTAAAAAEIIAKIYQPDACLTLFFCSPSYDLQQLGPLLHAGLAGPVFGCTTAGEISTVDGYAEGSLVGVSLSHTDKNGRLELVAHGALIADLHSLTAARAKTVAEGLHHRRRLDNGACFSLLLVDGMSMMEETTTAFLHTHLRSPLIGGSAGDEMNFGATYVYSKGTFSTDAAIVCLIETTLPFLPFKTQHIVPSGERLVITAADPATRRVMEIDGDIAAVAYAELLGITAEELGPESFSRHPIMLRLGGEFYVRSIQRVDDDGSLIFYCAIDNGLVLTLGEGGDLVGSLHEQIDTIMAKIGPPQLIIGFDCILRRLEIEQRGFVADVESALRRIPYIGFSSYGEQFDGVHVNQTLTGIAIGSRRR